MGDRNASSLDLAPVSRLAGRPTGPRCDANAPAPYPPGWPSRWLKQTVIITKDTDDFLLDACRLAPVIQGRGPAPFRKGNHRPDNGETTTTTYPSGLDRLHGRGCST